MSSTPTPAPSPATADRDWIASEFPKGIDAERELLEEAKARAQSPPDPSLGVLYNEIAASEERHLAVVETIATRYGYTPSHGIGGGISGALGRLKDKVSGLGSSPLQGVGHDLTAKANAIHWTTAWVGAFEGIGDATSARELAAVLAEELAHREALQLALNQLVLRGAQGQLDKK